MTLPVIRAGHGPRLVLVHGSATDHATWAIQLASSLRQHFELVTYDRRSVATLGDAARDLADVIGDEPALVVGSSFGAVVALELARNQLAPCAGLVLIEPPLPADDSPPDVFAAAQASFGAEPTTPPAGDFLARFDRIHAESGGPAAGEMFLRAVLGDTAFAKIPRAFLERSKAKWAEIRADCIALLAYAPRYAALRSLDLPVLLIGGEQSAPYFALTLAALAAALPRARRVTIPRAGHMLHAEAPQRFAALLTSFATEIGFSPPRATLLP